MSERNYWFGVKWLGIGIGPASWQGWLCVLAYVAAVAASVKLTGALITDRNTASLVALAAVVVETGVLIGVISATRDRSRPIRWRWAGGR